MAGELTAFGGQTTPDERTMAVLAHVLQLVGWWIAPLIIFVLKRDSRFVAFNALQALLLQIAYMVVCGGFMVVGFVSFFLTAAHGEHQTGGPPPAMFVLFPLFWLMFMGLWVVMIVVAIVYGIKAGRGEWAEYPLFGRLARRLLKIGPTGNSIPG